MNSEPPSQETLTAIGTVILGRRKLCAECPTPCWPRPRIVDLSAQCSLETPRWTAVERQKMGLGDIVEKIAKPIAKVLSLPCLDKDGKLRQESGCAKRRNMLNRAGQAMLSTIKSKPKPNAE